MDGFGRRVKVESGYGYGTSNDVPLFDSETHTPCGCIPIGNVKQVSVAHAPGALAVWTNYE